MKQIRISLCIIKMLWKDKVAYPGCLFTDLMMMIARCGVVILLYANIFKLKGGTINDTSFQVAAWSMFLYFIFMTLRLRNVGHMIVQDVKSGSIETMLVKPMNYIWNRFVWQFGLGLYAFTFSVLMGGALMFLFVGGIPEMTELGFYFSLLIELLLCTILGLIIFSIVGLFAFWMEDIKPLHAIIDKSIMILGGSYLPIALFPPLLYKVSIWSPFGASQFITHIVYNNWEDNFLKMISLQIFWIVLLGLLLYLIYKRAEKALTVNGG